MRGEKGKEDEQEDTENRKRRYTEEGRAKARERFTREDSNNSSSPSGFGRKPRMDDDYSDEDEDIGHRGRGGSRRSTGCKRFLPGAARLPERRPRPF